jgi:hypothetical protein
MGIGPTGTIYLGPTTSSTNVTAAGTLTAVASTASTKAIIGKAAVSATANIFEAQKSDGTVIGAWGSDSKLYVYDSAGASAANLQWDNNSLFLMIKQGSSLCRINISSITMPDLVVDNGAYHDAQNTMALESNVWASKGGLRLANNRAIYFSSTTGYGGTPDIGLERSAAGVLRANNGTIGSGYSAIKQGFISLSADPTTLDLTSGGSALYKNTTSGALKLWANDGGTMKSVALV